MYASYHANVQYTFLGTILNVCIDLGVFVGITAQMAWWHILHTIPFGKTLETQTEYCVY